VPIAEPHKRTVRIEDGVSRLDGRYWVVSGRSTVDASSGTRPNVGPSPGHWLLPEAAIQIANRKRIRRSVMQTADYYEGRTTATRRRNIAITIC
jgi:hypothetical protein